MNEIEGKSLEEPIIVEDYYFNTKHIKCIESLRHTVMSKVMSYVKTRDVCYLKFFIALAKSQKSLRRNRGLLHSKITVSLQEI